MPYVSYMCPPKSAVLDVLSWGVLTKESHYLWRPVISSPAPILTFHRTTVTSASTVCWYQNNEAQVSLQNNYLIWPDIILPWAQSYLLCKADNTWSRRDHHLDRMAVYCTICSTGLRGLFAVFAQFGVPILSRSCRI